MPKTIGECMTESLDTAVAMFDAEVMASIEDGKPTSQISSELGVPATMVVESLARQKAEVIEVAPEVRASARWQPL